MRTRNTAPVVCVLVLAGCQSKRLERAAPGQPSMHDLAQRRNAKSMEDGRREAAIQDRAKSLTDAQAAALFARLKNTLDDRDLQSTLSRYYQSRGDTVSINALSLWYIEHRPDGPVWPGNIDSYSDRKAYERGRALWLANIGRPGAKPSVFVRAAQFLQTSDERLSEAVLAKGAKEYPAYSDWNRELGMLYARDPDRMRFADAKDAKLLVATAVGLMQLENLPAAREFVARAQRLDPNFTAQSGVVKRLKNAEAGQRLKTLVKLSADQKAKLPESDRLLLTILSMQTAWITQKTDEAEAQARNAMALAARLPSDPMRDVATFMGNMTLGKVAFRRGDRNKAARYLRLAADAPADGLRWGAGADVNLARALINVGRRSDAAEYLDHIANKTERPQQYQAWAAQIRSGVNPVDMPFFTAPGCAHDPC